MSENNKQKQAIGLSYDGLNAPQVIAKGFDELAEEIMGTAFLSPDSFRFGASGLVANLHSILAGDTPASAGTSY